MDTTFATRVTTDAARADARLGLLAYGQGVVGVVGVATILLMYAIEVPRGGPYVFGSINDLTGSVFSALFIPVILRLRESLPPGRRLDRLTAAAVGASVAGIVLPILLVTGALAFEVQLPMILAVFELQSLWLLVAGRRLLQVPAFPRRLGRFTQAVGGSFLVGSAIALPALVLPDDLPIRLGLLATAAILAGGGWLAWPAWSFAIGRALRRGLVRQGAPVAR
jgi:hypothetical protein